MRIVYKNLLDDRSGITATNAAASLPVTNLAVEGKSRIFRTTTTSTAITVDWAADQTVNTIAIPWANFTSGATVSIELFNAAGTSLALSAASSDGVHAAPSVRGLSSGVNAFAYGGYGTFVRYFTGNYTTVRKAVVTITNGTTIDIARLVIGKYWEPSVVPDSGMAVSFDDLSKHNRAESGDLRTHRGTRHRKMRLDLSMMRAADRDTLWGIVRDSGSIYPMFISVLPTGATNNNEQNMLQMYCKPVALPSLAYQFVDAYSTSLEVEEM